MSPVESGTVVESGRGIARIRESKICGRDRAKDEILPLLIDKGHLVVKEVPRRGARPEIRLVRTKKKSNVTRIELKPPVSSD